MLQLRRFECTYLRVCSNETMMMAVIEAVPPSIRQTVPITDKGVLCSALPIFNARMAAYADSPRYGYESDSLVDLSGFGWQLMWELMLERALLPDYYKDQTAAPEGQLPEGDSEKSCA